MTKHFKQSQIYGWDEEPVDERPSEFMNSTGYSVLSGYHPFNDPMNAPSRARRRSRFGLKTVLVVCLGLMVLGGFLLVRLAPLLRH